MHVDRRALLHGLRSAAVSERDRRRARDEVRAAEALDELLARLAEMGRRMRTGTAPSHRVDDGVLALQFAKATDWAAVDALRIPADLSCMEAVALAMTVDFDAGIRLLATLR